MCFSVLLKIRFRHTQICVTKIGVLMSKAACINRWVYCLKVGLARWLHEDHYLAWVLLLQDETLVQVAKYLASHFCCFPGIMLHRNLEYLHIFAKCKPLICTLLWLIDISTGMANIINENVMKYINVKCNAISTYSNDHLYKTTTCPSQSPHNCACVRQPPV